MNKASKINTPPIPVFRKLMDTTPNVTRADLAKYLGVSAVAIGQYYNGDALPSMDNLIKIAKYFNVSTDYLLGLTDVKTTDTDLKAVAEYLCVDEELIKGFNVFESFKTIENKYGEPSTLRYIFSHIFLDVLCGRFVQCCLWLSSAIRKKKLYIKAFPDLPLSEKVSYKADNEWDFPNMNECSDNDIDIETSFAKNDNEIKLVQLELNSIISQWVDECIKISNNTDDDIEYYKNRSFGEFAEFYKIYQEEHHERSGGNGKHKED